MRVLLFLVSAITFGALAVAFTAANVRAAGNVLLPPTSGNDSSSLPNLGITAAPAISAPTAAAPATPAPTTPAPALTQSTLPLPGTGSPPLPATPAPPTAQNTITYPDDAATVAHLKPGQMQTVIIHAPDMSAALAQMGQNLPYGLTISLTGQSIFGANDVKAITAKLGLSAAQIPKACILTVRGIMRTSKSPALIDGGGASPQIQLRYDGTIQGYMMSALALCSAATLPPGSGMIVESGGRYQVSLQSISCPPPTRQVSQLNITYTGDSKTQCAYQ